jgi:uncharacterized protein YcgL (UPF0745 family)
MNSTETYLERDSIARLPESLTAPLGRCRSLMALNCEGRASLC